MRIGRREIFVVAASTVVATVVPGCASIENDSSGKGAMYGLMGKMTTKPGQRDALIAILLESISQDMPGCLSYIVAKDPSDPDAIWITEALSLPAVSAAIARARPLIAGFGSQTVTEPVGGYGLVAAR
jgi:quinol monooxygenase YgiN